MTAGFAGHATEPVGGNAVGGYVPDAPRDVPGAGAACAGTGRRRAQAHAGRYDAAARTSAADVAGPVDADVAGPATHADAVSAPGAGSTERCVSRGAARGAARSACVGRSMPPAGPVAAGDIR